VPQPPSRRALTLAMLTSDHEPYDALAAESIGRRDRRLLTLREYVFGSTIVAQASCPECKSPAELEFNVAEIRTSCSEGENDSWTISHGRSEVRFRLPNSLDLDVLDPHEDEESGIRRLVKRCVLSADGPDPLPTEDLPGEIINRISDRMTEIDPQADIRLSLLCPECAYQWAVPFDIATFLWEELNAWAIRLFSEVHTLASAYGWSESEILSMTTSRRNIYLEMVRA